MRRSASSFPEELNIPVGSRDDTELVRIAVETRDTLVTTDQALIRELNDFGIMESYNLQMLTPDEALKEL